MTRLASIISSGRVYENILRQKVALKCKLSCIIHHNDMETQYTHSHRHTGNIRFFLLLVHFGGVTKINASTENVCEPSTSFLFRVAATLSLCMNLMTMGAPDQNIPNATTAGINFA
jgi:hypothetical protein